MSERVVTGLAVLPCVVCAVALAAPVAADERAIVADLTAWFQSGDAAERAELATRIEADPAYDPTRLSTLLHRMDIFPDLEPGLQTLEVGLTDGGTREVVLRIPRRYATRRAWPLILAYHGSGDRGERFLGWVEQLLGDRAEQYVIAAPNQYRQTSVDLSSGPGREHLDLLDTLTRRVHVDADRIYALGYSLGGYCTWTLGTLHADRFAAIVPIASAYTVPADMPGLWETFLPNFAHLPVLHIWGERDTLNVPGFGGRRSGDSIALLNERLVETLAPLDLPITCRRIAGGQHGGLFPRGTELLRTLASRREHTPADVRHVYRAPHQGRAYWLEATGWRGDAWDMSFHRRVLAGAFDDPQAEFDALRPRLGRISGTIADQVIDVTANHAESLTVWLGDDLVDWDRPVTVRCDDRVVHEGSVERDLAVCLEAAERTRDFDRLWWARIEVAYE